MTVAELIHSYRVTNTTERWQDAPRPVPSFHALINAFLVSLEPKPSHAGYRRLSERYFAAWSDFPTFQQIEDWHKSLQATPHMSNKGLSFLKMMFTWGIRRGQYPGPNPATGVKAHRVCSRERVMNLEEVRRVLAVLPRMHAKAAALLLVLLTTGCRLSEALRMQRQHVNFVTGRWIQPTTKNGHPHETYLPTQARAAFARLPIESDYLFIGQTRESWSVGGAEFAWNQVREKIGLHDVRIHDFRRTFASHLYAFTKDEYLVKRCINHRKQGTTAIYIRITWEEVAAAVQAQADRFCRMVQAPVVRPALAHRTEEGAQYGAEHVG